MRPYACASVKLNDVSGIVNIDVTTREAPISVTFVIATYILFA